MRSIFNVTKVLFLCLLAIHIKPAHARPLFIDASADLVRLSISSANAVGNGTTDNSSRIQDAIDYLASNSGGGTLIFKPGTYKIANIHVKPGVQIAGTDREDTIFRAANTSVMFEVEGGELYNFTAYGTPSTATSGSNWVVGTSGGSATAQHIIRVGSSSATAFDVIINRVTAKESRYDVLYTRGTMRLQVLNSEFDRASRTIVTMAGNDDEFVFSGCRFGSLWGSYHFNVIPSSTKLVRNGVFLDCEFDGSHAGDMGTTTANKLFWISGLTSFAYNNDLIFVNCTFNEIGVRLRGTYYGVRFLYNPVVNKFVRVGSDVGELRDAIFRSNDFTVDPIYGSGITFTGSTIFSNNTPSSVNSTPVGP